MTSVWKRLQRVGKKASKFQFAASFQELMIECTNKWQPDKLRVVWIRRSRRHSTKLHSWQPGIQNPYRGLVIWQVPESLDVSVTLFKEPTAEEFEDKDWTFVIENETKGRRKVLASVDVNMKKYASATSAQYDITLKLKPMSVKVVEATLKLNLSCVFLKEGKATDEDMQSLASLMSMKQSDIGNLDDFVDSDDEAGEERRGSFGTGHAAHVSASALSTARIHDLAWRPAIQSGPTAPRRPHSFHSDSCPAEGSEAPFFSTCTSPEALSTSSVSATPSDQSLHPPFFSGASQTACPTIWRAQSVPSVSSVSSSSSAPPTSFPILLPPPPVPHPKSLPTSAGGLGSALTRPTSLPSAPETAPWQSEWRPPKCQAPLAQKDLSPKFLHLSANDPREPAVLPKKQRIEMPSSSSLPIDQSLEKKPQGGYGFVPSSRPQATPVVEPSLPPLRPSSALILSGPPPPPPPHTSQTVIVSPSDQDTEFKRQLSTLSEEDKQCTTPTTPDPRAPTSRMTETSRASDRKRDLHSGVEVLKTTPGPKSTASLLTISPRSPIAPGLKYFEMPKTQTDETESRGTRIYPNIQETLPPHLSGTKQNPDFHDPTSTSIKELLVTSRSQMSIQLGSPIAQPESVQHIPHSPTNPESYSKSLQRLLLHLPETATTSDTKPILRIGVTNKKEPITKDLGNESMDASVPSCLRGTSSTFSSMEVNKIQETRTGEQSITTNSLWEEPQRGPLKNSPIVSVPAVEEKITCITASLDQVTSRLDSHVGYLSGQQTTTKDLSNQTEESVALPPTSNFAVCSLDSDYCMEEGRTENVAQSINKRLLCERDCRVKQELVLPSSTVSIEEQCVNISKVEPGLLGTRGSSVSHLPSNILSEAQIEGTVRMPSMIHLLSSCSQYSKIPGMPSLHQSQVVAWPEENSLLFQTLPSKTLPVLLLIDYFNSIYSGSAGIAKMVDLTPSCSKSASIPGFPSAVKREPNMTQLLPTCPKVCSVPGLASVGPVLGYDKNVWDGCSLWTKKLQIKEAFVSNLSCVQEQDISDTNMIKVMVAMLPTCPRKASVPGFPSELQKASNSRSMASSLPTCPKQTMIAGMPFRQRLMTFKDSWHILSELILDRPLRCHHVMLEEKSQQDKEHIKHMVNMLPSCPCKETIPGFPSVPQKKEPSVPCVPTRQDPSMVDIFPTCPRKTRVPGFPSREPVSTQDEGLVITGHIVMAKPFCKCEVLIHDISPSAAQDLDKGDFFSSVALLPSCPAISCYAGMPTAPHKLSRNIVSLVSICPKQTQTPGIPSQVQNDSDNKDWHALRILINKRPKKNVHAYIVQWIQKDTDTFKYGRMVDMLMSCPTNAKVFGLPSAPWQDPSMVDIFPTCPRKTRVPGFPSREPVSTQDEGLVITGHIVMAKPFCKREVLIHDISPSAAQDLDKGDFFSSVALLPSCPAISCYAGMPTAPHKLSRNIVSLVSICPKQTQTPGIPSQVQNDSDNKDWHALRILINKRPKKNIHAYIVQWIQKDTDTFKYGRMVDMLMSCPTNAKVFGLPSAPRQEPSMVNVMPSCPRYSAIPGLPSKTGQKLCSSTCKEWFAYKSLQWNSPFVQREEQILNAASCFDKSTVKRMSALLPSCPPIATVPGFPSALTLTLADGPIMVKLLPTCTKESRVPGMPSLKQSQVTAWPDDRRLDLRIRWPMTTKWLLQTRRKSALLHSNDLNVFHHDGDCDISMVSILPSCPQTACLPGFPSLQCQTLAYMPSIINLLPTCPRHTRVCGIPSRFYNESDEVEWSVDKMPVWKNPLTNPRRMTVIHDQKMYFREMGVVRIMVSMLPSCPKHSNIHGIPSKLGERPVEPLIKEAPSMFKSFATLPKHSQIPGQPSKYGTNEFDCWFEDRDAIWENPFNRGHKFVNQDLTVREIPHWDKAIMLSMLPSCPRQALNPGFPSAPQPQAVDAIVQRNLNSVELTSCCPTQSSIIGFASRASVISDSKVGWPVVTVKTQGCFQYHQKHYSLHKHRIQAVLSPEPSCPLSDIDQLPNMVNIVPSCPKKASVLGAPSTHVHQSGQGWLVQKSILMSNQLPLEEQSLSRFNVRERSMQFIFPIQDEQEDVQQRTVESSTCPIEAIVRELPSSSFEIQVDQPSSRFDGIVMLDGEAIPARLDLDAKKTRLDVCSPLEMDKDEQGFWTEAKGVAVLEKGNLHCRMWHSIPDTPLFLSVKKRPPNMVSLQPSCPVVAGAAEPQSQTPIINAEQMLEKHPTNRTILWEELPEVFPMFPGAAMMLNTEDELKTKTETGMTDLLPICPAVSGIFEFSATAEKMNECPLDSQSTRNKPPKNKGILTSDCAHLKEEAGFVKQTVDKTSSHPSAQCMPYYVKTEIENKLSSFMLTCPSRTNIVGMPSKLPVKEKHSLIEHKPIWEKQSKVKGIFPGCAFLEDGMNKKEMVLLVPSCPREARTLGFPSLSHYSFLFRGQSMVDMHPCCPHVSSIPGVLSISGANNRSWISQQKPLIDRKIKTGLVVMAVSTKVNHESDMMSLLSSCPKTSCVEGFPSLMKYQLNKSWAPDYQPVGETLPKINIATIEDRPHNEEMKAMSVGQTSTKETQVHGFPSDLPPTVICKGSSSINLLQSCPAISFIAGFPSIQKADSKDWNIIHHPLWEKPFKKESVLILKNNGIHKDMTGIVPLAQSCPSKSSIFGFPSVPKPRMSYGIDMTNMISLSCSMSKESQILGFPSSHNSKEWKISKEPLFEPRMKVKQVSLTDIYERDERAIKTMISLVPSCPKAARMPGFPSNPNPLSVYCATDIISLSKLCPQVSRIPGIPSVVGNMSLTWVTEKGSLLKRLPTKGVIFDTSNDNKKIMKNMISLVPSCPKAARMPGFPSHPNPLNVYCVPDIISLSTLCPQVSRIPGIPSVVGNMSLTWVTEKGSLLKRLPTKGVIFDTSNYNEKEMKNMISLVPSCPKAARIPGFPSHPNPLNVYCVPDIISLSTLCPQVSRIPGIPSVVGNMSLTWVTEKGSLLKRLPTKGVIFDTSNDNKKIMKNMVSLVPSCPKAARMPGFPSHPNPPSVYCVPDIISLSTLCPQVSRIPGIPSVVGNMSLTWVTEKGSLLKRLPTKGVIFDTSNDNKKIMKNMVSLVPSCPKAARMLGFPSHPNPQVCIAY
ncbi:uncharacterized protein ehbp1l1a isoform X3 [Hippoglossus stenolepis]|uniref:uncharacterized protein ehbp1l1a isoform X3 n=1 Tax=Hippoglossus stenolepis TaxID=195615 RepID=UPI001FAF7D59|nr:uncharacterized protein ehbp1l1a isoform X3 [Hippoglossus stenolepis]